MKFKEKSRGQKSYDYCNLSDEDDTIEFWIDKDRKFYLSCNTSQIKQMLLINQSFRSHLLSDQKPITED
jgi:hypothetical protein